MSKRQFDRKTRRLETTFFAGTAAYQGFTSDISEEGIFIRTRYALAPGSIINIEIRLPDGAISKITGEVKRSVRTPIPSSKNGMGIKIIQRDGNFEQLLHVETHDHLDAETAAKNNAVEPEPEQAKTISEHLIIACPQCNVKNKVPKIKLSLGPRCGKCGTVLQADAAV